MLSNMDRHVVPQRDRALQESADLESVCRPRELSTPEVFAPNAFYGNDWLLKLYAGMPTATPLKTVVPHGIIFDPAYVWKQERCSRLPTVLAYSAAREQAYRRATAMLAIRSAVPFAYLTRIVGEPPPEREGTLFFPVHSSHRVTADADFAGMADALTRLDAKFLPVTVCIYWRDYELGHHLPFLKRGLQIASAGHMFDPAFLFRLYYLCQQHCYAASNHVGSSLLYSVIAGCKFFLLPGFSVRREGKKVHLTQDVSRGGAEAEELRNAFAIPVDAVTSLQSSLVTRICGLDHLLDASLLRQLLEMSDHLDKYGIARDPRTRRLHVILPSAYPRAAAGLVLAARRTVGGLLRRRRSA
jgi:hypothetical protein